MAVGHGVRCRPVAMLIRVVAPGAFWDSIEHAPAD
jgi:hypothetical protein